MSGITSLYRVRVDLAEPISAGDTTPMMVFPIGEWHSAKYPNLPLTEDLANELIANFEAGVLGTEPVVDSSGKHDTSAPAAGWVKRVYLASYEEGTVTGLALWADVKWTELGAGLLTDEQYKYGSVEIGPVTMNDSGEAVENVLRSLTLTNTPVLRLMPGVKNAAEKQRAVVTLSLSEITLAEAGSVNDLRDALERAIGRGWVCDFGPDWVVYESGVVDDNRTYKSAYVKDDQGITLGTPVEVKRETTYVPADSSPTGAQTASSAALSHDAKANEGHGAHLAEGDAARKGVDSPMKTVALKLNLSEDADEKTILAEVVKLEERVTLAETERDEAKTKLAESEKATHDADVNARLDAAVDLAEITPGERITLAEKDDAARDSFLEARKGMKAITLGESGSGERGDDSQYADASVDLDEKSKARAKADSIQLAEAQKLVLAENEDLAQRYSEFRMNPRKEA